ncbi:MAG: hypothetical protein ABWY27_16375 [Telluria sp.]
MKTFSFVLAISAAGLLAATLAGCSAWQQQRPGVAVSQGDGGSAGYTAAGSEQLGAGMTGDQGAMCELNRRLLATRDPDARQAMVKQYLPNMSPELREQHLRTMRERCQ